MRNNKFKNFFVIFFISTVLLGMLPIEAFAQFNFCGLTPLNPCSTYDFNNGDTVGATGVVANNAAIAALEVIDKANLADCTIPEEVFAKKDKGVSIGLGGLSLISGGALVAGQLTAKIGQLEVFKTCHQGHLEGAKAIIAPSIFVASRKQLLVDEITKQVASLKAKEEPISNQLKVAQQGFWKTLVYNILIKTTKTIAMNMVNKLAQTYKIKDFSKYADAVATQVYDNEFILDNFSGAKADQMLVRSMLSNPALQSQISSPIFQRADLALGFDPNQLAVDDPNFYQKAFYVGSGGTNPFMQQAYLSDTVQAIHYKSLVTSQAEIAQSTGLKTPRDCRGTMAQQKELDKSYDAVNKRVENRQALLKSLVDAKTLGQPVKDSDIQKAQNDVGAAERDWQALPNSVESPIVTICEAIVSPPSLINKGIDQAFNAIGQNVGTYNENNLPFFINFISDVANSITNQLIFAGGVSGSKLLNENIGNLTKATSILTTGVTANAQVQQSKNLIVSSSRTDDGSNTKSATYQLDWDANSVNSVTGVAVSGPGVPASLNGTIIDGASGSVSVTVPIPGTYNYTVTAYGKSKADVLATVTTRVVVSAPPPGPGSLSSSVCNGEYASLQACLDGGDDADHCNAVCGAPPPASSSPVCNGQYPSREACLTENPSGYCDSICVSPVGYNGGSVAGAYVSLAPLSPRGSAGVLHPR
jgi:hypothetical protein